MTTLLTRYCDPYGGDERYLGGLSSAKPKQHWYCRNPANARYRMVCAHEHQGQVMWLCESHGRQFTLRDMTFCPRCNTTPPGHKCYLTLVEVS